MSPITHPNRREIPIGGQATEERIALAQSIDACGGRGPSEMIGNLREQIAELLATFHSCRRNADHTCRPALVLARSMVDDALKVIDSSAEAALPIDQLIAEARLARAQRQSHGVAWAYYASALEGLRRIEPALSLDEIDKKSRPKTSPATPREMLTEEIQAWSNELLREGKLDEGLNIYVMIHRRLPPELLSAIAKEFIVLGIDQQRYAIHMISGTFSDEDIPWSEISDPLLSSIQNGPTALGTMMRDACRSGISRFPDPKSYTDQRRQQYAATSDDELKILGTEIGHSLLEQGHQQWVLAAEYYIADNKKDDAFKIADLLRQYKHLFPAMEICDQLREWGGHSHLWTWALECYQANDFDTFATICFHLGLSDDQMNEYCYEKSSRPPVTLPAIRP